MAFMLSFSLILIFLIGSLIQSTNAGKNGEFVPVNAGAICNAECAAQGMKLLYVIPDNSWRGFRCVCGVKINHK